MPKLSIISPVYNVGQYLNKFLESLEKQTFQDFEVVFVYDESNDDSLAKITSFSKKDIFKSRVKIIKNKDKKGAGFARDLGFKNSNKESSYVMFLDSDDYFDDDYIETLISKAEMTNADITCCGYYRINALDNRVLCEEMTNNPDGVLEIKKTSFPLFLINPASWNKIFKRSIIEECKFSEVKRSEDLFYFMNVVARANTICFINKPKYTYLIHQGSLINTLSYENYKEICEHFLSFQKFQEDKQLYDLLSAFVFIRIGIGSTIRVCQGGEINNKVLIKESKKYLKESFNVFKKNKFLSFGHLRRAGKKGVAIWILKIMYKLNLFHLAVKIYIKRQKKNKKEIRW